MNPISRHPKRLGTGLLAAAVLAGIAGLTTTIAPTVASSSSNVCLPNYVVLQIRPRGAIPFTRTGWTTGRCISARGRIVYPPAPVRGSASVDFQDWRSVKATLRNILKCTQNSLVMSFYRRKAGAWKFIHGVKKSAVPIMKNGRITRCRASADSKYHTGSLGYLVIVRARPANRKARVRLGIAFYRLKSS